MDPYIDYIFGPGDGSTTTWTRAAPTSISAATGWPTRWLDFDGDGRRDDAMWDTDGDGVADLAAIDIGLPTPTLPTRDRTNATTPTRARACGTFGRPTRLRPGTDPMLTPSPENTKPQDAGSADTKPGSVRTDIELRATRGGGGRLHSTPTGTESLIRC